MNVSLKIISISNLKNKSVIARIVAQNPTVTLGQIIQRLEHLPGIVIPSMDYDESTKMAQALEKMGCVVEIEPVAPKEKETKEKSDELSDYFIEKETPPVVKKAVIPDVPKTVILTAAHAHKKDAAIEKVFQIPKKLVLTLITLLLFSAVIFIAVKFFSVKSKHILELEQSVKNIENELNKNPLNTAMEKKAVEIYREIAKKEESPSKKIQYLSKAAHLKSGDIKIQKSLSSAYNDTAKKCQDTDFEIKFYKLAISFNQLNEEAWNGLINAYDKTNQKEKALQAKKTRDDLFKEYYMEIIKVVNRYGKIIKFPYSNSGSLFVHYNTNKTDAKTILMETYYLFENLCSASKKDTISIYAILPDGSGLHVVSPAEKSDDNFKKWKTAVLIENISK